MRDPKRKIGLLKQIQYIWEQYPDLRLCQLLGNCFPAGDLYYVEDEELSKKLKETYENK